MGSYEKIDLRRLKIVLCPRLRLVWSLSLGECLAITVHYPCSAECLVCVFVLLKVFTAVNNAGYEWL